MFRQEAGLWDFVDGLLPHKPTIGEEIEIERGEGPGVTKRATF
jgi:hypothetical protein